MTEDEAKTKWCPFASSRALSVETTDGVRYTHLKNLQLYCIASECMAWRWTEDGKGYCGMAGKP